MVGQTSYETTISDDLSVLPLFILMGSFINRAGLGQELYDCANAFLGHRRGGLAMATVAACGGFAAVSGSSMATAATMSKVAMPAMRRYGYADSLAAGSIAAGGTLGILIPPSVIMVIYGIMTSTDIGKLFIAGIIPGIIGIGFYVLAVATVTAINPKLGPPGERSTWRAAPARAVEDLGRAAAVPRSSWAASISACSPRPKPPASAPAAPSCSRSPAAS